MANFVWQITLPETNSFDGIHGWLEDDPFLLGVSLYLQVQTCCSFQGGPNSSVIYIPGGPSVPGIGSIPNRSCNDVTAPAVWSPLNKTSWWFLQPIWKICASQIGFIFNQIRGENKTYLSCHHPENSMTLNGFRFDW